MKGAVEMNNIDLHMHSHYSDDGEFTPAELMRCVKMPDFKLSQLPTITQ